MFSTVCSAQEMRPLDQLLGNTANPYPFQRCAGLYQALMEWVGQDRMGEATFRQTETGMKSLLAAAILISIEDGIGGGTENATQVTLRDTRNIADLYNARFKQNYAVTGQAFGEDILIQSDLLLCKDITEQTDSIIKSRQNLYQSNQYNKEQKILSEKVALIMVKYIIDLHMLRNNKAIEEISQYYSNQVNYYGKITSLTDVIKDKSRYFRRWPERNYRIRAETVSTVCGVNLCRVNGIYDWSVRSVQRNKQASGSATFSFSVEMENEPRIVSENSEVISRSRQTNR